MPRQNFSTTEITGIVLAGGRGRRMGGDDKGLIALAGRPLVEHAMGALAGQSRDIVISANRNLDEYARYGRPVVADTIGGFQGPLAGIAAALAEVDTPLALVVPCDGPRPPDDLARRLHAALLAGEAEVALAHDGRRLQPLYCLLRVELRGPLTADVERGHLKVQQWMRSRRHAIVDFADSIAAFDNINTPDELAAWDGRRP